MEAKDKAQNYFKRFYDLQESDFTMFELEKNMLHLVDDLIKAREQDIKKELVELKAKIKQRWDNSPFNDGRDYSDW